MANTGSTTVLPNGGAVTVQTPGKRAVPSGGGSSTTVVRPSVAKGGGKGATGKLVGTTGTQPGRTAVSRDQTKFS